MQAGLVITGEKLIVHIVHNYSLIFMDELLRMAESLTFLSFYFI